VPIAFDVRRFFCESHLDQAQPGDMEPRGSGIKISESGALVPIDEDEEARAREQEKRIAAERQAAEDQRAVEAEHWRRHQEAIADETRRLVPPGIPA
jgi:hypothetical protein